MKRFPSIVLTWLCVITAGANGLAQGLSLPSKCLLDEGCVEEFEVVEPKFSPLIVNVGLLSFHHWVHPIVHLHFENGDLVEQKHFESGKEFFEFPFRPIHSARGFAVDANRVTRMDGLRGDGFDPANEGEDLFLDRFVVSSLPPFPEGDQGYIAQDSRGESNPVEARSLAALHMAWVDRDHAPSTYFVRNQSPEEDVPFQARMLSWYDFWKGIPEGEAWNGNKLVSYRVALPATCWSRKDNKKYALGALFGAEVWQPLAYCEDSMNFAFGNTLRMSLPDSDSTVDLVLARAHAYPNDAYNYERPEQIVALPVPLDAFEDPETYILITAKGSNNSEDFAFLAGFRSIP